MAQKEVSSAHRVCQLRQGVKRFRGSAKLFEQLVKGDRADIVGAREPQPGEALGLGKRRRISFGLQHFFLSDFGLRAFEQASDVVFVFPEN